MAEAYVTLATNDSYSVGALVLGHSLRRVGSSKKLVVMITPQVTSTMRVLLEKVFDQVHHVNVLDSRDTVNLELLTRPDLGVTFTKLHCWRLTQYQKCVFMDADTLVVQNIDDLFEREELSAASDCGWPDCFNSGVFVYRPSLETYRSLLQFALDHGSYDGGDQGLLNRYFNDWATKDIRKRLPFVYNVVPRLFYTYLPAFKQFGKDVKVIHFIGSQKPWHYTYNVGSGQVENVKDTDHHVQYLQLWWTIFVENHQQFKQQSEGGHVNLSDPRWYTREALNDVARQYSWERGQIDYLGIDAFDNIRSQLEEKLSVNSH